MRFSLESRVWCARRVVLFMKGTPEFPPYGFSANANESLAVDYIAHDVLADPELRQGIKQYSDWPTIPQLYVNGVLIGGADIVHEMYLSHELGDLLRASDASSRAPSKIDVE
jgi:monothiol glutaredoxin